MLNISKILDKVQKPILLKTLDKQILTFLFTQLSLAFQE